jgi:hypothetical protein
VSGNVCDAPGTGSGTTDPLHRCVRPALCATLCSGLRLSDVREIGSYGFGYGLVDRPALEDSAPSRRRVLLAYYFPSRNAALHAGNSDLAVLLERSRLQWRFPESAPVVSSSTC